MVCGWLIFVAVAVMTAGTVYGTALSTAQALRSGLIGLALTRRWDRASDPRGFWGVIWFQIALALVQALVCAVFGWMLWRSA